MDKHTFGVYDFQQKFREAVEFSEEEAEPKQLSGHIRRALRLNATFVTMLTGLKRSHEAEINLTLLRGVCTMCLLVRSFDTHVVDTNSCQTGADLKIFLAERDEFPLNGMQLYAGSSVIRDHDSLDSPPADCNVGVLVPILGGKVHGSLARAGKVRVQTPKVEKQEKNKKPRGRAKRRMQYNKRFVARPYSLMQSFLQC
ncbi:small subunit ribosomal protein S30e [Paragonimus westermani]|uniref:Small subunit ribosomal protein S30e n=1 Tax=Paragonimus westermani TaxID=34504 RepID=A0A5J4NIU1_9TREM|nr:small subunit ribosomal protein S30e [Paragonimus westermani]